MSGAPEPHGPDGADGPVLGGGPAGPRLTWLCRGLAALLFVAALTVPGLPLDGPQRAAAAATALTATLWLTAAAPVALASLAPAVALVALGVLPVGALPGLYGHRLVLLFLGAFVVALGLERWGVHRRVALWIIARVGTSRPRLVLGFMAASAVLSMWINNTATTLLMLPIIGAVLARFDLVTSGEDRARFSDCLLLGVAYAASVGGMGTPVGTAPNQVFLGQFAEQFPGAPEIGFGVWFVAFAPLVAIFVPVGWLLLTRILRPLSGAACEGLGADAIRSERAGMGRMSTPERRMAAAFVATAVLWVFRADIALGAFTLPGWQRLVPFGVSDAHVALSMAALILVCPAGGGPDAPRTLMDLKTARGVPWEVLLLLGGGFCIAAGFRESGLDRVVGDALGPWLEGRPRWIVVAVVALSVSFLTEITSNTATTAVLMPVMGAAAVEAGIDPRAVMLPAAIAASAAFMMPVATPPNAVVFATRRIPMARMARVGFPLNLTMVAIVVVVFELWSAARLGLEGAAPAWAR